MSDDAMKVLLARYEAGRRSNVPTSNIIQRVFLIATGDGKRGTCFTLDIDGRQYIITAKHIVENVGKTGTIRLRRDRTDLDLPVRLVGHSPQADISVLAANALIPPNHKLEAITSETVLGSDVFFCGFPANLPLTGQEINNGFPLPFFKKGIVSAMDSGRMFIDGHTNPGLSGGPVVWVFMGKPHVIAVLAAYHTHKQPVHAPKSETTSFVRENAGIVVSYDIGYALELIKNNPVGFPIPPELLPPTSNKPPFVRIA